MPKKRNSKSFEIALSGICCAFAVTFLALGILSGWLLATGYFIGVIALMVPLAKDFYLGDFLAYIATCILTVIMGAAAKFWDIVPFVMFFGIHPLVNALLKKKNFNIWLGLLIKAAWFDCTLIVGYYLVYGGILGGSLFPAEVYDTINKYVYLIIFTVGTFLGVVYDLLITRCQQAINILVKRIKK